MIQGGCPQGTGTGGPGYNFDDEPHPELVFDKPYLLAMANAGVQGGKGTNGSQFFITVSAPDWLNRKHTIFGEVADQAGRDVVDAIAAVADRRGRPPGRAGRHRVGRDHRSLNGGVVGAAGPGRGADLLSAPRPRDLRPLPAVREADLPRLHARRGGRLPVPRLRQGGGEEHPPGAGGVRRPPVRGPAADVDRAGRASTRWCGWRSSRPGGPRAPSSTGWRCSPPGPAARGTTPASSTLASSTEAVCTSIA